MVLSGTLIVVATAPSVPHAGSGAERFEADKRATSVALSGGALALRPLL
jgi:hypothetical protein